MKSESAVHQDGTGGKSCAGRSLNYSRECFFLGTYLHWHKHICVPCGTYGMETRTTAINQDGSAGEFSFQGTCATPVNIAAVAAKDHASTFGHVLAGCMADIHRRYATESGQDEKHPDACTMDPSPEVGKR